MGTAGKKRKLTALALSLALLMLVWQEDNLPAQAVQNAKNCLYTGTSVSSQFQVPQAVNNDQISHYKRWMPYEDTEYGLVLTPSEETAYYPFIDPVYNHQQDSEAALRTLYGPDASYMAYELDSIFHPGSTVDTETGTGSDNTDVTGSAGDGEITDPADGRVPVYSAAAFLPQREGSFLGNCGVWIRHFGTFQGKVIDCKCTFYYECLVSGENGTQEPDAATKSAVYPVVLLYARKDGVFGLETSDMGVQIRFQLYEEDAVSGIFAEADAAATEDSHLKGLLIGGTSAAACPVNVCLAVGGIDQGETIGVCPRNGAYGPAGVPEDSQVYGILPGSRQVPNTQGSVIPGPLTNYLWAGAPRELILPDGVQPEGEMHCTLQGCSDFDLVLAGWLRINKTGVQDNRYRIGEDPHTRTFADCLSRYHQAVGQVRSGYYNPGEFEDAGADTEGEETFSLTRSAACYLTAREVTEESTAIWLDPEIRIRAALSGGTTTAEEVTLLYQVSQQAENGRWWILPVVIGKGETQAESTLVVPGGQEEAILYEIRQLTTTVMDPSDGKTRTVEASAVLTDAQAAGGESRPSVTAEFVNTPCESALCRGQAVQANPVCFAD